MRDINDFQFTGPFAEVIPLYVQHKRACGYKVAESELYRLREIDNFFKDAGINSPEISQELYEAWNRSRGNERPVNTSRRRTALLTLGKFLLSEGYQNICIGCGDERIFNSDYVPYVFSKDEILRIFKMLDLYCETRPGYQSEAFRTMISMYYCCGFRKSEVTTLQRKDADLHSGKITILNSKNNVSRIVVVSDTLRERLIEFSEKYHTKPSVYFFYGVKNSERPFDYKRLYTMYHELLQEVGIPDRPDGRQHRLHDMRHTFCVYALEQMQEKGFDLYTSLPLLSTYLGHKHIKETEYYLRLVDSRHNAVLERVDNYVPGLFPDIGGADIE